MSCLPPERKGNLWEIERKGNLWEIERKGNLWEIEPVAVSYFEVTLCKTTVAYD
jgi:hypothetical protein